MSYLINAINGKTLHVIPSICDKCCAASKKIDVLHGVGVIAVLVGRYSAIEFVK